MGALTENDLVINPRETGWYRFDFAQLFGNANPVILEIGSGKGRFLIATATERPDVNLVGIEKSLHYHRLIRDRILKRDLTNIRLVNYDAFLVLKQMVPDASIAEIHVYFPDPWPRKKEQKRRIIRPEVLTEFRRVLVEGGRGIYVTDHQSYYEAAAPAIATFFESEARQPGPDDPPRTNYEAKYRAEGREIYEVRFQKK
ncbi:MAG TPA: tRNA (guanosine(46)-N7)-methyltransferase TrmB [Thermoanaerobaculia bacterium]|jgi:tRNA (guanine-N7-)-methyltransferase